HAKSTDSVFLVRNRAGRDQIALGAEEARYAYVIPREQRDPVAAVELLRRLAFGGVRVYQLTANASPDDSARHPFTAGTWVVPTDQEFAAMAREVLDVQRYPDLHQYPGGPPERPYDAAAWTLPLQMGVNVIAADRPLPDAMRQRMKLVGAMPDARITPSTYDAALGSDRAPFDSPPGVGFDSDPDAAAILPPSGAVTGSGPVLMVDPAQNHAFRALN